jgi:hypothetical protein
MRDIQERRGGVNKGQEESCKTTYMRKNTRGTPTTSSKFKFWSSSRVDFASHKDRSATLANSQVFIQGGQFSDFDYLRISPYEGEMRREPANYNNEKGGLRMEDEWSVYKLRL